MGAVVGARRETVEAVGEELRGLGLPVWIGNVNSSTQFVLTGSPEAVRAALDSLAPRALNVVPLTMNWPIHCELMRPVAEAVAPVVEACRSVRAPLVPFYGPDGLIAKSGDDVYRYLGTEFCHPTLWNVTVEAMIRDGFREFLEVGPGQMLSRMLRWIDRAAGCRGAGTVEAIDEASRMTSRILPPL